ncbi:LysR family transcriptional regulator [Nocardioides sp. LHG3406-4]|uniref:LysR family transcriptional regulator n=1 Tax=Nocardioides sp. LHG3406-4 TaxID=2804575 RepID=UPI003CEE056C
MDPRRVLVFRTVARAGSLSAAARELGWTQPAVSQHLQRLEREAGTPLLVRSTRGVTLTEAGRLLLVRADAVAGELHMAAEEMASLAQLRGGRVRLIAFPSAAATLVPAALRLLARDHPTVEVGMVEAEPPETWSAVREGAADLGLVFGYDGPPPDDGDLTWVGLGVEPVHLVLPPDHPAASRRAVRLKDLAQDPWIGGCPRCRQHLVARCREAGFEPRLVHESDDYVAVQALVAAGLGVTLLPSSALEAFQHPEVAVRPSATLGTRHLGLVHRPGAENVPATGALIERLRTAADATRA